MLSWPRSWTPGDGKCNMICKMVQRVAAYNMAVLVVKGAEKVPEASARVAGFIDIWWVVHDGGLMLLLSTILRKSKVWNSTRVRVFCVLQQGEDPEDMTSKVEHFVYTMRIEAQVQCVVLDDVVLPGGANHSFTGTKGWQLNSAIVAKPIGDLLSGTAVTEDVVDESRYSRSCTGTGISTPSSPKGSTKKHSIYDAKSLLGINADRELDPDFRESIDFSTQAGQMMRSTKILNLLILRYSRASSLVLTNLPLPPEGASEQPEQEVYMKQVDSLTKNLPLCLLVYGQRNADVVTMYS